MQHPPLEVKVWGEFACFTRPEMKVERVSYPVMTPSAARGVLESIFWKPEISWQIRQIWVLKPIRHFSILRNEIKNKAVFSTAKGWAQKGGGYFADADRTQRHTLALRDVAYLIKADMVTRSHDDDNVVKYRDQFRRRVNRGQCCHTPYLGCREFTAYFGLPEPDEEPIGHSDDLGRMLFDLDYAKDGSGRGKPRFFPARMEKGILKVPCQLYKKEATNVITTP